MTWMRAFYLRAFVVLLQITVICSEDNGPLPGFKQQPIDTLIDSSNQSVICDVYGKTPLKISWLKEEKKLDIDTSRHLSISKEGSLNIINTQRNRDEGNYRCMVENEYGRVFSKTAAITFPYMNEFSAHDARVVANAGDRVLLKCRAPDSYPDKNIYWSKYKTSGNFVMQVGALTHFTTSQNGDLYFSYIKPSDEGLYYCSVENSKMRRFERRTVKVVVKGDDRENMAPQIWSFTDHVAIKDSNFIMECIAYGRPVPVMTFRNVKTGSVLTGAQQVGNRLRYEFGRFTANNEGEYVCEVKNAYAQKSSKVAFIKMEAKPELLVKSREIQVAVDSMLQMPCIAHGIPPAQYTWFFNGNSLSSHHEVKRHAGNLTITNIMKHHQGFYQCLARNKHGETLLTLHVTAVEIPASFGALSIPPAPSTQALVGGSAEINCVPSGAPKPTIKWRKLNTTTDVIFEDERYTVLPTGTLKIVNIKRSDAGQYECVASNKLRTARESGKLIVHGGLAITEPLTTQHVVKIGTKMSLRCTYNSNEQVEILFQWFRSRVRLKNSGRTRIRRISKRQSVLEIKNAQSRDSARYTCKVLATKKRKAEKSQMIIVGDPSEPDQSITQRPPYVKTTAVPNRKTPKSNIRGPPRAPTDVAATELSGLNIKISWTMGQDNGAPATRVYIQARTTFDMDVWHNIKTSNKTKRYRESNIVRLSPWVEYKIRVISENKYGKSEPSVETNKWIRTPTAKPVLYPENVKGDGTGPNELTISFDPLEEIDQNAPGIGYIVHYRAKGSSYGLIARNVPDGQNKIKINFLNTDSDSYYKAYEFQVQAKNNQGMGPKSPMYTAHTGERVPLISPTNLRVKLDEDNNAIGVWNDVTKTRSSIRGKFLGYKFIYWIAPEETNRVEVEQYVISETNKVGVDLTPYTSYYFQVLTYNGAGDGPRSETFGPLLTPEGVPSLPANFKIVDASLTEVKLGWSEPSEPNGIITEYLLSYRSIPSEESYSKTLVSDKRMCVLKGLTAGGRYLFKLAAATKAGVSQQSEISVDLSKVPQTKLDAPVVKSRGYNAIVLAWLSAPQGERISGYKLFYWKEDDSETKAMALWEESNDIITTVHDLEAATTYFFQIAIVNGYGTGPRSAIVTAKTKFRDDAVPKADQSSTSRQLKISNYFVLVVLLIAVLVPR